MSVKKDFEDLYGVPGAIHHDAAMLGDVAWVTETDGCVRDADAVCLAA
jgi:hypothetical protein